MLLLQFVDHWVCLEDWAVNYSWKSVFRGDDYKDHVKCVTEDEKYGGKDFEAKTSKGDAKQQEWLQVRAILYTDISNSWLLNWLDCFYWSRHCWQKKCMSSVASKMACFSQLVPEGKTFAKVCKKQPVESSFS